MNGTILFRIGDVVNVGRVTLKRGRTYTFTYSSSAHRIYFTSQLGSQLQYTQNVTVTPGVTVISVTPTTPILEMYCELHTGMRALVTAGSVSTP